MSKIKLAFLPEPIDIPIGKLLLTRKAAAGITQTAKYEQISVSMQEIGIIEPLSVSAAMQNSGFHAVLDGLIRFMVAKDLGYQSVPCLISTDDEHYTYNNRTNGLSTIQEHYMIKRAIERGVPEERLAKALNLKLQNLRRRASLLDGVCPEATRLLKDQEFSPEITKLLKQMKPVRQIECVELMTAAQRIQIPYLRALLLSTPVILLTEPKKRSRASKASVEKLEGLEREMGNLKARYKNVEETYGQIILDLVLARGYVAKLLDNDSVSRFIRNKDGGLLRELETIARLVDTDSVI